MGATGTFRPRVLGARLYLLEVRTRVPWRFGHETLERVLCARAAVAVGDDAGGVASGWACGWGETPLSVPWAWPGATPYAAREGAMVGLCEGLTEAWAEYGGRGSAMELGAAFAAEVLPGVVARVDRAWAGEAGPMPALASLVASSAFDLAVHDGCAKLLELPVYETYSRELVGGDLSRWLEPAEGSTVSFAGRAAADYLRLPGARELEVWHAVGGLDPVGPEELRGDEPDDGYPVLLSDWIERGGVRALKLKLGATDPAADAARVCRVAAVARPRGVTRLGLDFNCTAPDPGYVEEVLSRVGAEDGWALGAIDYLEQPFDRELGAQRFDVRGLASRWPLLLDESAHGWREIERGRAMGYNAVALKTCKTQTGALLSLCWAAAHGMGLMVHDLTNPMIAQVSHLQLAAHTPVLHGVETNSMQYYPAASAPEAAVHRGLFERRRGCVELSSIRGPGFGYRLGEIGRELPEPAADYLDPAHVAV